MSPLIAFLNTLLPRTFAWGETDCILVCADWVNLCTGIDPAGDLRLTYSSRGECQRVTRFFTDPLGVTTKGMEQRAGLPRTDNPVTGDVAVVRIELDGRIAPVGAICLGLHGWAFMAEAGITIRGQVNEVLRAWSVGYAA